MGVQLAKLCCVYTHAACMDAVCESLSAVCSHADTNTHTHTQFTPPAYVHVDSAGTGPPPPPVEVTAEADPSVQSTFSPAIPAAAPNPTVYLTEEEDGQDTQTAEIAWSADATTNIPIGMLQVKPGTTYTLKVPPQQEEVVMKFTTFGNSKCLNLLPFMGNIQT